MTRGQANTYCPMSSSVPDSRMESNTEAVFNRDVRISEVENKIGIHTVPTHTCSMQRSNGYHGLASYTLQDPTQIIRMFWMEYYRQAHQLQ